MPKTRPHKTGKTRRVGLYDKTQVLCQPCFGGINPVCHDRHKTVPEFILILYDQMWMIITYNVY